MLRSKLLIFKLGKWKYACKTDCVDRIIKYENLTCMPSTQPTLEGLYNHEGNVIKIYNLAKRLGVESFKDNTHKKIIIVKNNDTLVGVIVDEVLEVFNYIKDDNSQKQNIENVENLKKLDFKFINDTILVNNEIIIYLCMSRIIEIELEESKI